MAKGKNPKVWTAERRTLSPDEIKKMRVDCVWEGCDRSTPMAEMRPPDWHSLLVYWSPFPDPKKTLGEIVMGSSCYRDAILCPEHAKALDGLFKDIGRALSGPAAGSA